MSLDDLVITDQRLGEGGFGSVFMCKLGEKQVAAKKLSQSEEEFNNLVREASKLKRLRHGKHIASTYGITMNEKNLYMVMEYCELGDLQNYLKKNKESVTYERKMLFCRGILLGLLYCHLMKIFHGDIKCSNVILGKNLEPKLTDFGLSMTVENIEYYSKLYKGSLYWAAPELFFIKEDEAVYQEFITDPYPCDVYSLGATFCEISYGGTTEFIDSDDPGLDITLGIVFPIPKDAFLKEIVDRCCQFEREERISLGECLSMLDSVTREQLLAPAVDDKWLRIQQDIQANSKLKLPPSFILYRPAENLVVGLSNLSLLEWLCINNCVDALKYMIQLHKHNQDQDQVKWLYGISELCKSLEVANFLQSLMKNSEFLHLSLSNLIDNNPQQFIEMLIEAGASFYNYNLLKKAIKKHFNIVVQGIIDSKNNFKNWAIHYAVKFGNTEAVKILVGAGANLEYKDHHTGNTPLITAIESENIEIVKILLELGADVHNDSNYSSNSLGVVIFHSPLYLAALKDNREIVKLLIDAGATVDIASDERHSLSQSLEQQGNTSMVRFISNKISKKSNPVENSSLCTAIQNKQPNLVQMLIDNKTSIDEISMDGYAPLHWAVIAGNEEIVRILVRTGVDLDIRTSNEVQNFQSTSALDYFSECTPLHIAISKGYLGIVKFLIKSGADFSAKNGLQQTVMDIAKEDRKALEKTIRECAPVNAISIRRTMKSMSHESIEMTIKNQQVDEEILSECLCIAISSNKIDLAKCLLKHGFNINKKYQSRTPLEWAMFGENIQAMEILINAGADVHVKNKYGETPLIESVTESNAEMVQFLIDKGADLNAKNEDGYAPIHYVNDEETMRILINADADVNAETNCGRTPLIEYVTESNTEMVQFLIDKGADVNSRDKSGKTPIHYVDDKEVMKILINAGADINVKSIYGGTLLIKHITESNAEMVQFLVDKGADVNSRNKYGKTPICYVIDKEIMRILINAGADVNAETNYGRIPLIEYVTELNAEMVQFLIDKGADINSRDEDGKTPIRYANDKKIIRILINAGADVNAEYGRIPLIEYVTESNAEMVQFLVDKGADVNSRDKSGKTPIHYANDKEIIIILINAGADVNAEDEYGETPLIEYVTESNAEVVQFLIDKGVDVNSRDEDGNTSIHYVNDKEIMRILINAGADVNKANKYGRTPLIESVTESNAEMVQFLIDKGADINSRDEDGKTPICYANDKEIIRVLINAGADVNAEYGRIPLIEYVTESNAEMVQFLIDKGADVNSRDKYGKTPIHYANDKEIIIVLINAGANANEKNKYGKTPLTKYVTESNAEMVQFLVDKEGDVNARDVDKNAPIHYTNDKEIMRILINAGADVNKTNKYGGTLLIESVTESNAEMVQFLIDKGADVNSRDKSGKTPIHYANDKEIIIILINVGADINAEDGYGETPLIRHLRKSNVKMVQFLVDKGADVNSRDEDGKTPIRYVDDKEIMRILINAGADVNKANKYGRTPLIKYVTESNAEMVQFLIDKGADVNARDEDGNTSIHYVNDKEIMRILINAGADVNKANKYGRTPLIKSVTESNAEMVRFLVDKGADINASDKNGNISVHFIRDKVIAEILITAGTDVKVKDRHGKRLFNILIEEQNNNLSNSQYRRKQVCELLKYLRDINKV